MSTRENLIEATRELLWERGYESMSPRAVLERSGAGQGSLYHHFRGKLQLARAALEEVRAELSAELEALLPPGEGGLAGVLAYLRAPREALKGCRLGRLAHERAITTPELRTPVAGYLAAVTGRLASALTQAQGAGELPPQMDPDALAATLAAVVQGGYVLSRAQQAPEPMAQALRGAETMLLALREKAASSRKI